MNEQKREYFRSFSVSTKTGTSEDFVSLPAKIIYSTIGKRIRSKTLFSVVLMDNSG
jgi:hypothetical protein